MATKMTTRELSDKWDALGFPYQYMNAGNLLYAARQSDARMGGMSIISLNKKALVVEVDHNDKTFYFVGWFSDDEIEEKGESVRYKRGVRSITILSSKVIK